VVAQEWLRRRFKKAVKAAGLPEIRFHVCAKLRHAGGAGVPAVGREAYMGHANIETTMIYVHHLPQHDAADKLTALVSDASNAGSPRETVIP